MSEPYPICGACRQRHLPARACRYDDLYKNAPERAKKATPAAEAPQIAAGRAGAKRPAKNPVTPPRNSVTPKRRGPKPSGKALTAAERQRLYRQRKAT